MRRCSEDRGDKPTNECNVLRACFQVSSMTEQEHDHSKAVIPRGHAQDMRDVGIVQLGGWTHTEGMHNINIVLATARA